MRPRLIVPLLLSLPLATAFANDWPTWGNGESRNMAADGRNAPVDFDPGKKIKGKDEVDLSTTKGLKWTVRLGSQAYGTPTIANGRVYVGTNNENPFDTKYVGDKAITLCLDEKTGKMIWQFVSPKLGTGKVSDWEYLGMCSPASVDGNRLYIATNRCEVVCLDVEGLRNGNDGPFTDELKYLSDPNNTIDALSETDADIIWVFDMREECGVFPHNMTSSSVLVLEDRLYVTTSNGMDWTHSNIPAPEAPSLICLDKKTGKLLGEEGAGVSRNCLHCSWASPARAKIKGVDQIIFAGGDGFCHGFDLTFREEDGLQIMNDLWKFDGNAKEARFDEAGNPKKYMEYDGPSEIIATPVVYKEKVYTLTGQDPEHGEGIGRLSCIDPSGRGDLSGKPVWEYKEISRSISTPAIVDDSLYVADYSGIVHCLNALTGEKYWTYDTKGHIWGSTLVVDGKLYVGNEEGELHILEAGRELKKLAVIEFPGPLYATPVFANETLYVMTMSQLYAFGPKSE